jgi:hypothetical protein
MQPVSLPPKKKLTQRRQLLHFSAGMELQASTLRVGLFLLLNMHVR